MEKINRLIKSFVATLLGTFIAVAMFPIAFPIVVYKSIINSKRTKNGKK